jgi:hypothetical protein
MIEVGALSVTQTLKNCLQDWTDIDGAQHQLAQSLGLMISEVRFAVEAKHVYWSNNPVGNALYDILIKLVEIKVLEYRDEPSDQVRWNRSFRGTWERQ